MKESWDEALFGGAEVVAENPKNLVEKPKAPQETHDVLSAAAEIKRQVAALGSKHATDPGGGYLDKIKELQDKAKKLDAHENAS